MLDGNYRKYKMIERSLMQSKVRLMGKLPEIQKAEEAVDLLLRKQEAAEEVSKIYVAPRPPKMFPQLLLPQTTIDFSISDQAYAKAVIPVTHHVNLWLGANVMLEYTLEDAKTVLVGSLTHCFNACSFDS